MYSIYKFLAIGDRVRKGDEYWDCDLRKWCSDEWIGVKVDERGIYRRKMKIAQQAHNAIKTASVRQNVM